MSLAAEERRDLRDLLVIVIPEDAPIWTRDEGSLNELTLAETERFLGECTKCTKAMQQLFLDLAGGLTRGWLRRVLRRASKAVAKEDACWRGNAACYVATKSRFRSPIHATMV